MDDVFESLQDTVAEESAAATEEPSETQEEQPQEEAAPPAQPDEDPFSEAALSTPEGIARAREVIAQERSALQEEQRKFSQIHARMKKRELRAKEEHAALQREREAVQALNQRLTSDLNALRSGDARGIIDTLGRLAGRPGKELFEEIALAVATDGKGTPESRKLKELEERYERRVKELEDRWEQERRAQQERETQAAIERRKQELVQLGSDASRFPAVAYFVGLGKQKEVAETLTEYKMRAFDEGSPISDEEAVQLLESELKPHMPAPSPAPGGGTGNPHSAPAQKKPVSGGLPGQTLAPSLTTQPVSAKRELTDEEHRKALEQDQDFWRSLGA